MTAQITPLPTVDHLVAAAIAARLRAGQAFTAYDITTALRQAHPHRDLPHAGGVRELVHAQMQPRLQAGEVREQILPTPTGPARQYVPARPVIPTMLGWVLRVSR